MSWIFIIIIIIIVIVIVFIIINIVVVVVVVVVVVNLSLLLLLLLLLLSLLLLSLLLLLMSHCIVYMWYTKCHLMLVGDNDTCKWCKTYNLNKLSQPVHTNIPPPPPPVTKLNIHSFIIVCSNLINTCYQRHVIKQS